MSVTHTNWSLSATYDLSNPWPPADRWVCGWGEERSYSQSMSLCSHSGSLFSVFLSVFSISIISFSRNLTISFENNTTFQSGCLWNQKARPWWLNYSVRDPGVPRRKVNTTKLHTHKVDRIRNGNHGVFMGFIWPQTLFVHHFMFNEQLGYVCS